MNRSLHISRSLGSFKAGPLHCMNEENYYTDAEAITED